METEFEFGLRTTDKYIIKCGFSLTAVIVAQASDKTDFRFVMCLFAK